MTKTNRLLSTLQSGEELTVAQIRSRFGLKNPTAQIDQLRKAGYPIYLNSRINSSGETKDFYRIGTPTRRMIAAATQLFGARAMGLTK